MNICGTITMPALRGLACLMLAAAAANCAQATQGVQTSPTTPATDASAPAAGQAAEGAKPGNQTAPAPKMATAPDGTKIAYEVTGDGPALMLVHGGGQTRKSWAQLGYVERLAKRFTVITVDLRGIGDSDKPMMPGSYDLEKVTADLIAVADAAGVKRFHLWGFGHGGTIARHLAATSDRVASAVLVGMTMGPAVTGVMKEAVTAMRAKWQPLIDAHAAKTLDPEKLPPADRSAWDNNIAVSALSLGALLDYPDLEPSAIKAPTLWVVGADDSAMENAKAYEEKLAGTNVSLKVLSSVNYSDSFVKIDQVLPEVEAFLLKLTTS